MLLFDRGGIRLYNDDFLKVEVPEGQVNLFVTSPPYNIATDYGAYSDDMPHEDYLAFTERWLSKAHRLAADGGRMCVVIPIDTHRVSHRSFYADFVGIAKETGWSYSTTIIIDRRRDLRYVKWGYTGSFQSAAAPQIIAPAEALAVLYKGEWIRNGKFSDITKQEFLSWATGIWSVDGAKDHAMHPAAFSYDIPWRCLKLYSFQGDTVMDPFSGIGTTLRACAALRRKGIGVELNGEYCRTAVETLQKSGAIRI